MITFLMGSLLKIIFGTVITLIRGIFGPVWTTLAEKVTAFRALPGVDVGLGLFDMFVGIDFIVWATGFAVYIIVTIAFIKLVLGLFSKG